MCGTSLAVTAVTLGLRFPWGAVVRPDPVLVIGRDATGPVALHLEAAEYDRVSRRHAQVTAVPGGLVVEDLGSLNGTSVNGTPIAGPMTVRPGDRVAFSRALIAEVIPA